jgi:4-amino-4-deoxy-L-arabinose transferase-like glycosyltransferase
MPVASNPTNRRSQQTQPARGFPRLPDTRTIRDGGREKVPSLIRLATSDGGKLAAMWLAVTAYNLFKPYHIDDTVHLEIARWIAGHPLHPMGGELSYGDVDVPIHSLNQPPLYFYLLAGWGSLFGYGEATMHALQASFSLAAIVLFHRIARRVVPANAVWLTGMLVLGPGFVVEQNLMVDVPLLALWLLFFDALILGVEVDARGQSRHFLVAALACSAAILVKYSSLILVPLLFAVIVYERRWRLLWVVLVPIATVAAWSLFNYLDYGGVHLVERPARVFRYSSFGLLLPVFRFIAMAVTLGAITPFGLIAAVRLVSWASRRALAIYLSVALLFVLFAASVAAGWLDETSADKVLRVAFLINAGAMALAVTIVAARARVHWRRPGTADARLLILLLWIAGHVAFYSLYSPFMAVRHVLLVLPPVLLVGALMWPALPRADAIFGLVATVALSIMLGWSDWRFAAFFRDEPAAIRASLPADAHIWFTGGMGWGWYAIRAGLRPVNAETTQLVPGDYLAEARDQGPVAMRHQPNLIPVRTDNKRLGFGDLFCTAGPARFYATPFTDFTEGPWLLTRSCTNFVDIYRVAP